MREKEGERHMREKEKRKEQKTKKGMEGGGEDRQM